MILRPLGIIYLTPVNTILNGQLRDDLVNVRPSWALLRNQGTIRGDAQVELEYNSRIEEHYILPLIVVVILQRPEVSFIRLVVAAPSRYGHHTPGLAGGRCRKSFGGAFATL